MEVAGDIVQDLVADHLGVTSLESEGTFPLEMEKLSQILQIVEDSNSLRTHFSANISESAMNLKAFIIKAEAALMLDDMEQMKKWYT